jgi:hypothetical protein
VHWLDVDLVIRNIPLRQAAVDTIAEHLQRQQRQKARLGERYTDSQPYCQARFPFPTDLPITAGLLRHMARSELRHKDECSWQLSLRWRPLLRQLREEHRSMCRALSACSYALHDHEIIGGTLFFQCPPEPCAPS